jgi:hypothetical protein
VYADSDSTIAQPYTIEEINKGWAMNSGCQGSRMRGLSFIARRGFFAATCAFGVVGCAPTFTVTPLPDATQTLRYEQGTPTTFSDMASSSVQVTPLGVNNDRRLVFGVAAFNKGRAPSNFGVESLSLADDKVASVHIFTTEEIVHEAKVRAAWAQVAIALSGAAAAYAANANAYQTTNGYVAGPYGTSTFSATTYDPAAATLGTAAAVAGTAYGITAVQHSLDSSIANARTTMLQTTTVDPGSSYGGTTIADDIRDYPQNVSLSVNWNGDVHVFKFNVTKQ